MLYMKEMRAKVVAECTLKESAAINQILGRRVSGCGVSSESERAGAFGRLFLRSSDFPVNSGTPCPERSKLSTTSWPGKRGNSTPNSTQDGRRETTT